MKLLFAMISFWALIPTHDASAQSGTLKDAVTLFTEVANVACPPVSQGGMAKDQKYTGTLGATLSKYAKPLADLNMGFTASVNNSSYQGVLQEQLATMIDRGYNCRLATLKILVDRIVFPFAIEVQNPETKDRSLVNKIIIKQASYPYNLGSINSEYVNSCVKAICQDSQICEIRGYAGPLKNTGSPIPFETQRDGNFAFGKCNLPHPSVEKKSFRIDYSCSKTPQNNHSEGAGPNIDDRGEAGFGVPIVLKCPP